MSLPFLPKHYNAIQAESRLLKFNQISDDEVGVLLRLLVSSKHNAKILELGTGTGMGLSWIAQGLRHDGELISVEKIPEHLEIAKKFFEDDPRIQLVNQDATLWIEENKELQFDLIFADTWAGKFTHLDSILNMVKPGGFYLIDDLNYQVDWHKNHQDKVLLLVEKLKCHPDFFSFPIGVGTGMLLLCKK